MTLMAKAILLSIAIAGSGVTHGEETTGKSKTTTAHEPAKTLAPISVTSNILQETETGPVKGYVAKKSATGTKTDMPIEVIAKSISIVTRDELDDRGVKNLGEAIGYTAGVLPAYAGVDPRVDFFYIRGFDQSRTALYRDGLKINFSPVGIGDGMVETYGLERVEIVKGPSSFLYGQVTPGGLVNTVTKRPTIKPLHEVQVEAGSYDHKQAAIDLGGAVDTKGTWSYRLTGLVRDSDTQIDFVKDDRVYIAPAATWRPSENTTWTLLANYQRDKLGSYAGFLPREGTLIDNPNGKIPVNRSSGEPSDHYDKTQTAIASLLEHRLNDTWQFKQNVRLARLKLDNDAVFGNFLLPDKTTITRTAFVSDEETDSLALDNQFIANIYSNEHVEHTLLFGLDYQWLKETRKRGSSAGPSLNIFNPSYGQAFVYPTTVDRRYEQTQLGVYLQDQININDHWYITLGGRWDDTSRETKELATGTKTEQDDDKFTKHAGVLYRTNMGLSPYLSYSESFTPKIGTDSITGKSFKPITGEQYEIGLKWQPEESQTLVTLALFEITQANSPVFVLPSFDETQTGEVRSRGFELEAKTSLNHWDISASYTYLDAEVTKDTLIQGQKQYLVPKNTASLWTQYSGLYPELSIGMGVRYIGERTYDYEGIGTPTITPLNLSSYTVTDASVRYNFGASRVSLNVNNLFDKTYVAYCSNFGSFSDFYGSCNYGAKRRVTVNYAYRW